jgi:hypothetical protein
MTELWLKLLGAPTEHALHVAKASLAFRGGLGAGAFIFWLLALGALVWWLYRASPLALSPLRRYALTALRVVFIALLLGLLLRPVLAFTVEGSIRRTLVLLLDASSSMQIEDARAGLDDLKRAALGVGALDPVRGLTQALPPAEAKRLDAIARQDLVKSVLGNDRLALLPRLAKEFDLDAFAFGQELISLVSAGARSDTTNDPPQKTAIDASAWSWINDLAATNTGTALGDALKEVVNRKRGQPLAGVFLVTDGANNRGSPPREIAGLLRQEGLPLYIYGVGITSPRDFSVGGLLAPDVAFAKDVVPVNVRVRAQGLRGASAELTLKAGGAVAARQQLEFAADGEQVVTLNFTPQAPGEFELEAALEPRPDESVRDNNARTHRLRVIDARIKVLLADQAPRWEFRYLQAMLLRDRRVDLSCWLAEGDPAIARGPQTPYLAQFPAAKEELFKYDLVIFGDLDPKLMSMANLANLSTLVSDFGGALIVMAGKRFTPQAYRRTALEKLLPVEFDSPPPESARENPLERPIRLELTSAGAASPMLRFSDQPVENLALWKQLPPVYWVARVTRPKPAAEVLVVDSDPARASRFGKMPVIALQQYGLGQVLYVGTDNLWRWRRNVGESYHTMLWGQMAQRVSLQRLLGSSKRTQLSMDRQNYMTGERVSAYARLYGVGFEPLQQPVIKGFYGLKDGTGARAETVLRALPEQPGLYRGEWVAPAPGRYQFWVEHDMNTALDFTVAEPQFEWGETAMNEAMLKDLAATTGGAFLREENLHALPDLITAKAERVQSPMEVELWCSPLYFLLLLGVVTAEWVLRKRCCLK